jgi:hypothetical protein
VLVEYDLPPKIELYAAMNVVARVLNCTLDEEKQTLCDEARADLDEIIKAVLTPDSVFVPERGAASSSACRRVNSCVTGRRRHGDCLLSR